MQKYNGLPMSFVKIAAFAILAAFTALTAQTALAKAAHAGATLATFSGQTWQILVLAQFAAYLVLLVGGLALMATIAHPDLAPRTRPLVWATLAVLAGFLFEDASGALLNLNEAARKDTMEMLIRACVLATVLGCLFAQRRQAR